MEEIILATASSLARWAIAPRRKPITMPTASVVHEQAHLTPQGWRLIHIAINPPPAAFLL
jgi:hypothetical protein